jgi:glutathione S-transferase
MKLYYSTNSPYARKVRVLILELNLTEGVELLEADTKDLAGPVCTFNPLAKVPVLLTDDGIAVYDSPVISEFLAGNVATHNFPGVAPALKDKCLVSTADGILDAGYAARLEKIRPQNFQWQEFIDLQFGKINRTLDRLDQDANSLPHEATQGAIALACALEWIQFRHAEGQWLINRLQLAEWAQRFSQRPSMMATRPE